MTVEKEMFLDVDVKQVGMEMIECQLASLAPHLLWSCSRAPCFGRLHHVIAVPLASTSGGSGMDRSSPGRAGSVCTPRGIVEHTEGVTLEPRTVDELVDAVR